MFIHIFVVVFRTWRHILMAFTSLDYWWGSGCFVTKCTTSKLHHVFTPHTDNPHVSSQSFWCELCYSFWSLCWCASIYKNKCILSTLPSHRHSCYVAGKEGPFIVSVLSSNQQILHYTTSCCLDPNIFSFIYASSMWELFWAVAFQAWAANQSHGGLADDLGPSWGQTFPTCSPAQQTIENLLLLALPLVLLLHSELQ